MERLEKIQEMREVLTFLDDNPEIPLPYFGMINTFAFDDEDDVGTLARIMSPCEKNTGGGYFSLDRKFGSTTLSVNFDREEVCERIVVGTEQVLAHTVAAHTKEIVEWRCPDSILRQEEE